MVFDIGGFLLNFTDQDGVFGLIGTAQTRYCWAELIA